MAHKNKAAGLVAFHDERGPVVAAHVKREQILREYFGWMLTEAGGRPWSANFSKNDIGAKRYGSVMASLSRALRRLEGRGLIVRTHSMRAGGWSGVELTEEGEAEARRILERRRNPEKLTPLGVRVATEGGRARPDGEPG